jgi:hypothetical protein
LTNTKEPIALNTPDVWTCHLIVIIVDSSFDLNRLLFAYQIQPSLNNQPKDLNRLVNT